MTNPDDRDLAIADDGQTHTRECIRNGWWLLDWDADCVEAGVPAGGPVAAHEEIRTFVLAVTGGA